MSVVEVDVLTPIAPSEQDWVRVIAAVAERFPQLRGVRVGRTLAVVDASDGEIVTVESPRQINVAGESERLLGRAMPVPYVWTTCRAQRTPLAREVVETVEGILMSPEG